MMRPKMGQQLRWYLLRREHPLKQESSVKTLRAAGRAAGMGCKGKAGAEARRGSSSPVDGDQQEGTRAGQPVACGGGHARQCPCLLCHPHPIPHAPDHG